MLKGSEKSQQPGFSAVSAVMLTNTYDYVAHINYYGLCYFL